MGFSSLILIVTGLGLEGVLGIKDSVSLQLVVVDCTTEPVQIGLLLTTGVDSEGFSEPSSGSRCFESIEFFVNVAAYFPTKFLPFVGVRSQSVFIVLFAPSTNVDVQCQSLFVVLSFFVWIT